MDNILTYVEVFRTKKFNEVSFNIIDALILSQIIYYDYTDGLFKKIFFNRTIRDFYKEKLEHKEELVVKGMMTAADDMKMISALAEGGRHGNLRACRYVEEFCPDSGKQFAAITFELGKGEYFIAFRGTDTSVVGWHEDFALSYEKEIPAQRAALRYAEESMLRFPGKFYIGGHSKGGNLAVYAAMNLPEPLQKRLKMVYSFDGPGFLKEVYEKSNYENIRSIVCKIIPQSAIVGKILEEYSEYKVVSSNAELYLQHSPYSWNLQGNDFVYVDSEDSLSKLIKRCLDGWLDGLPLKEREKIINTVFKVIYDTGINTFDEITEQRFEKIKAILNNAANMDSEEKNRVHMAVRNLLSISAEELRRTAREESTAQLEKRAAQIEVFLQSIQKGEK